jgi:hypothetical protein
MTNSNVPRKKLNKSDCSFDPLVPAIASDCVHVPHIGELHYYYLLLWEDLKRSNLFLAPDVVRSEVFHMRVKKYRSIGGRLF